jgi:hypothetical protein
MYNIVYQHEKSKAETDADEVVLLHGHNYLITCRSLKLFRIVNIMNKGKPG